jgi:hypothetical protein
MLDRYTGKPIKVHAGAENYSSIIVCVDQLEDVRRILDIHTIPYRVSEHHISINNAPFTTIIDLGRQVDPSRVQQLLDAA